jgi:hypothetical protein
MAEEYATLALGIITQAEILKEEDLAAVSDLAGELLDNFLHSQVFRTRTEMEVSVLNDTKFPTPDAKYWQAQREQHVHFQELVMLSYEYRKNEVEIRQLKKKWVLALEEKDKDEAELIQIEIERRTFIARNHERIAKDRIREIREWHEIKENLIPRMKCGLADCDEHQLVSYTLRWIRQAQVMGDGGTPSERNNLMALLDMGLKKCREKGIMGKVLDRLDEKTRNLLRRDLQMDEFNCPPYNRPVERITVRVDELSRPIKGID